MSFGVAACVAVVALMILAWPVSPLWQKIYSPYQMLELGHTPQGYMEIRAAGHYYQRVFNLANPDALDTEMLRIRNYYDLPYRVYGTPSDVAVVGAGSGNDVAAAVRSGAKYIDAIEIDPAILAAGRANHPEQPYDQPQVRPIVNDARTFLRTRDWQYDMVVYGLLDSHTLLSHASSVRLDSFVYTVEGFRDARSRLKDDGRAGAVVRAHHPGHGAEDSPHARRRRSTASRRDASGPLRLLGDLLSGAPRRRHVPPGVLGDSGSGLHARFAEPSIRADISTDDWPFFYMPQPRLSGVLPVDGPLGPALSPSSSGASASGRRSATCRIFFLGAGFMLVETKGITELGLIVRQHLAGDRHRHRRRSW